MKIHISTGGFRDLSGLEAVAQLAAAGAEAIELSGGRPDPLQGPGLEAWSRRVSLAVHHYFPPPDEPCVINLASTDPDIARISREHVRRAIAWAARLGSPFYSVHAGYLVDPRPRELGRQLIHRQMADRPLATRLFVEAINSLSLDADKAGVTLLIENNVLTRSTFDQFGGNPLLMVDPDETVEILRQLSPAVGLLVDVAHAKVSAGTLGFPGATFLSRCQPWVRALHLSDNDGTQDTNDVVDESAWFWGSLPLSVEHCAIEVYGQTCADLVAQATRVSQWFTQTERAS